MQLAFKRESKKKLIYLEIILINMYKYSNLHFMTKFLSQKGSS